jgi:hypothetical protein
MGSTGGVERGAASGPPIDVLAFPPARAELQRWQLQEGKRWRELERRARVALFFGVGMFLAWAADVGAAFDLAGADASALFGVVSIPIAIVVVVAHLYGQWTLERSGRGLAELAQHYADVTLRDAAPLLALARDHAVVAQYLRCVGREGRPLLNLERIALYKWVEEGRREQTGAG